MSLDLEICLPMELYLLNIILFKLLIMIPSSFHYKVKPENFKWSSGTKELVLFSSSLKFTKFEHKYFKEFLKKYYDVGNVALYHFVNF
jgi:hypothetical protein